MPYFDSVLFGNQVTYQHFAPGFNREALHSISPPGGFESLPSQIAKLHVMIVLRGEIEPVREVVDKPARKNPGKKRWAGFLFIDPSRQLHLA